eukprot:353268-Chlamydomonas_euryale.AAC.5
MTCSPAQQSRSRGRWHADLMGHCCLSISRKALPCEVAHECTHFGGRACGRALACAQPHA